MSWYMLGGCVALLLLSVWKRARLIRLTREEGTPEPLPSPATEAVKHLVGVAGGVYVTLISLASFLRMPLPDSVTLLGVTFDPLAMAALLVAILQPFLTR